MNWHFELRLEMFSRAPYLRLTGRKKSQQKQTFILLILVLISLKSWSAAENGLRMEQNEEKGNWRGKRQNAQPLDRLHEFRFNMDTSSFEQLTKTCLDISAQSAQPETLNVTFHLYSERNPATPFVMGPLISRRELSQLSPFNWSLPSKFVTHGFSTTLERSNWMIEAKDKILANERANVILVNWGKGASPWLWFYPKAAANMHIVAQMIVNLLRRMGAHLNLNQVHLIGHSLGAHIMGFVGSSFSSDYQAEVSQLSKLSQVVDETSSLEQAEQLSLRNKRIETSRRKLIGRITACDPALPCFGPKSESPTSYLASPFAPSKEQQSMSVQESEWTHLKRDSALLVEVLHTNPRVLGYDEPLGDFDFYPNGHSLMQPGCRRDEPAQANETWAGNRKRSIFTMADAFTATTCSHHRAVDYMVESLYSDRVNVPITSVLQMQSQHCRLVAYACSSYENYKRGFCFQCRKAAFECRIFGSDFSMSEQQEHLLQNYLPPHHAHNAYRGAIGLHKQVAPPPPPPPHLKSKRRIQFEDGQRIKKRILPDLAQTYLDSREISRTKYMYYFDTEREKPFCKSQYHLLVRYRHPRPTRDKQIQLDQLELVGSEGILVASLEDTKSTESKKSPTKLHSKQIEPLQLNRFTDLSYTSLIEMTKKQQRTSSPFLGQLHSLSIRADDDLLRPGAIDFIEVTYMSHWDAHFRAQASARFCLASEQLDLVPMATRLRGFTSLRRCSQLQEKLRV